jgi:glycine cleavage system regulatory protein
LASNNKCLFFNKRFTLLFSGIFVMTLSLVLTVIADDKPGIVETMSAVISRHNGNWTESHLASLAGKFAGIVLVTLDESDDAGLQTELAALSASGIEIRAERGLLDHGDTHQLNLSLVGNDRPGIVREVSRVLASLGVNVLELNTECVQAEMSALALFKARANCRCPIRWIMRILPRRWSSLVMS